MKDNPSSKPADLRQTNRHNPSGFQMKNTSFQSSRRALARGAALLACGLALAAPVKAASAGRVDLLVTDLRLRAVIRVDSATGNQTVLSAGGSFVLPVGIAVAPSGDIFVVDADAFGGSGGIIR